MSQKLPGENRNIYLASSWRNKEQEWTVNALRDLGHQVYDFKNPAPGNHGFHWSEIDSNWKKWTSYQFKMHIHSQIAEDGYGLDFGGMEWADTCVLLLPCGKSAHLELGYMLGAGKQGYILLDDECEPELMYLLATGIASSFGELIELLWMMPK